jgi:hypothetical protein
VYTLNLHIFAKEKDSQTKKMEMRVRVQFEKIDEVIKNFGGHWENLNLLWQYLFLKL